MSETQQTTAERIEAILGVHYDWTGRVIEAGFDTAAVKIAAEIETLTAERDAARAEVERLRPAAEAWEALQDIYTVPNGPEKSAKLMAYGAARDAYGIAAARARKAAKVQA